MSEHGERVTMNAPMILYDLPGPPYHPADLLLAQIHRENRMRRIRDMDIDEWVESVIQDG